MSLASGPEQGHVSQAPGNEAAPSGVLAAERLPVRTPAAKMTTHEWTPVSAETLTRVRAALRRL